MSTKAKKESKIKRYLKAAMRALGKARDFYVRSFSSCAGNVAGYGGAIVYAGPQMPPLLRSFSVNSSTSTTGDDDFRELIRAASTRSIGNNKIELDLLNHQDPKKLHVHGVSVVPRSQSTATIWRIDEDKACEFGHCIADKDVLQRSKSHVVSRRSRKL